MDSQYMAQMPVEPKAQKEGRSMDQALGMAQEALRETEDLKERLNADEHDEHIHRDMAMSRELEHLKQLIKGGKDMTDGLGGGIGGGLLGGILAGALFGRDFDRGGRGGRDDGGRDALEIVREIERAKDAGVTATMTSAYNNETRDQLGRTQAEIAALSREALTRSFTNELKGVEEASRLSVRLDNMQRELQARMDRMEVDMLKQRLADTEAAKLELSVALKTREAEAAMIERIRRAVRIDTVNALVAAGTLPPSDAVVDPGV